MTDPADDRVICRQCGTSNAAGDQFCGNCGTFLEWSAEPVADVGTVGVSAPTPDESLASLLERPAGAPAGGNPATGAAASAPAPAQAPSAPAPLVRCPTCGTANEAGKTFCLKCGNKLAGATVATRLPLPPRPAPSTAATGTSPATGPTAVPGREPVARRREPVKEGRGGSSWLLVGGAGIAVGAVVVAAVLLLGSGKPPPPAAASSAPSASVTASQAPSAKPSASKPAKTPKPTAKPKPTK
jgi:hypothetical protein